MVPGGVTRRVSPDCCSPAAGAAGWGSTRRRCCSTASPSPTAPPTCSARCVIRCSRSARATARCPRCARTRPAPGRSRRWRPAARSSPTAATTAPTLVLAVDLPAMTRAFLELVRDWPGEPTVVADVRRAAAARVRALRRRRPGRGAEPAVGRRRFAARAPRRGRARRDRRGRAGGRSLRPTCSPTSTRPRTPSGSVSSSMPGPGDVSTGAVRRPVTSVRVRALDGDDVRDRPDKVVTEEPMEIRVHGPGQEPARSRSPCARRATTSSSPSASAAPRASSGRAEDLDTVAYCLAGEGEQEYNVVTVKLRRPIRRRPRPSSASSPTRAAGCAARPPSTRSSSTANRWRTGPVVARSVIASLPERLRAAQRVFDATGGLHAAATFTPDGELLAAARGRRAAQRARQARRRTRCSTRALPLARHRAHGLGPGELRDRAEGGDRRHPDRLRGLGAVEPRGRRGRAVRADARGLPARRPRQRVHAFRSASTSTR